MLKSDTARLELREIQLVLEMGTLGSMYTTVEGLLKKVRSMHSLDSFHVNQDAVVVASDLGLREWA